MTSNLQSLNLKEVENKNQFLKNMNSKKGVAQSVIIGIIAVILVIGGIIYFSSKKGGGQEQIVKKEETTTGKESETMMKKDEGMMGKTDSMMHKFEGTILSGSAAPLLDFTKSDYDAALKTDKLIVLYFYANWCPICKAEFPKMQEVFNELSTDKVIGFRVNYNDDQTDNDEKNLAREFGVAYQHTKVFVKNGTRILKSPEGWDDKRYDTEINKALTN